LVIAFLDGNRSTIFASMAKLFIVGIPKDMQEIALVEMFSIHGTVNTVTIVTDQVSGESKGYGFITMTDDAGAERAIAALDGADIDGRTISVRVAEDKNPKQIAAPVFKKPNPNRPAPTRENRTEVPRPKRPRRPS
jgi:RNA recognition motif-containing protein